VYRRASRVGESASKESAAQAKTELDVESR